MVMVKPSIYKTVSIWNWTLAFIMGSVVHMSLYQNVHKKYYFKFLEQTDFIPFN